MSARRTLPDPPPQAGEGRGGGAALYRLLAWLSPGFPTGGFSYSHGLETAVEDGLVGDVATLVGYVRTVLGVGAGALDAALLAAAARAIAADDARGFLAVVRAAWGGPTVERWSTALGRAGLAPTLTGFLHALAANLVSAGVRLIPLGQTDGQRALAALESTVAAAAARAAVPVPLEALGSAAPLIDLLSMRHETQYTRLFRS